MVFLVQKETMFIFIISNSYQLRKVLQHSGKMKWKTICSNMCESKCHGKVGAFKKVGITPNLLTH